MEGGGLSLSPVENGGEKKPQSCAKSWAFWMQSRSLTLKGIG